jgi:hypothetical protein
VTTANVNLNAGLVTGVVVGRSGVTLLARLLGSLGTLVTKATVSGIAYKVVDLTLGTVLGTGTFVVASSIFDALVQTDPRWVRDNARAVGPDGLFGYNFLATLPAVTFPAALLTGRANLTPADRVHCDVTFTPTSGEVFVVPYEWTPIAAY